MDVRCVEALTALADGALGRWHGLPDGCTRADVDQVFALVSRPTTQPGPYSGRLDYAPTPGAPNGLTVYYGAGAVDYITVVGPQFEQPVDVMLGEPEGRLRSDLEGAGEQWVYPRLGLALHMKSEPPGASWLYVFGPTTLDDYRTSPLGRVRTLRHKAPRTSEEE
jgi:hypothetical protein